MVIKKSRFFLQVYPDPKELFIRFRATLTSIEMKSAP